MRTVPGRLLLTVPAAVLAAGCSGTPRAAAPSGATPGCGLVPPATVVGLLGADVETRATGSVSALRAGHGRLTCRTSVPGHPERYVTLVAEHHPAPFQLPTRSCSAGWVYAGTPAKYTPACQDTVGGHGRTRLFVRWQPYLMHVSIGRSDRNWGGDPEVALAMSRALAERLGVREARGNG